MAGNWNLNPPQGLEGWRVWRVSLVMKIFKNWRGLRSECVLSVLVWRACSLQFRFGIQPPSRTTVLLDLSKVKSWSFCKSTVGLIWFQGVNITLYAKVARFLQQACEPKVPRVYVELFHWKGWTRHRTFSNPTRNIPYDPVRASEWHRHGFFESNQNSRNLLPTEEARIACQLAATCSVLLAVIEVRSPRKAPRMRGRKKHTHCIRKIQRTVPQTLESPTVLQTVGWSKIDKKDFANFETLSASVPLSVFPSHFQRFQRRLVCPCPHPASAELSCHQVDIAAVPRGEISGLRRSPVIRTSLTRHLGIEPSPDAVSRNCELWFPANSLRLSKSVYVKSYFKHISMLKWGMKFEEGYDFRTNPLLRPHPWKGGKNTSWCRWNRKHSHKNCLMPFATWKTQFQKFQGNLREVPTHHLLDMSLFFCQDFPHASVGFTLQRSNGCPLISRVWRPAALPMSQSSDNTGRGPTGSQTWVPFSTVNKKQSETPWWFTFASENHDNKRLFWTCARVDQPSAKGRWTLLSGLQHLVLSTG